MNAIFDSEKGLFSLQDLIADKSIAMLSGSLSSASEAQTVVSQLQYPIPVSLTQLGRSSMIVFSNCDIDSAVDCIADKGFFASGTITFTW